MKENMKAEAAALIAEMRKRSVTGTGITLSAGSNGLLVAAFDAMQAELDLNESFLTKEIKDQQNSIESLASLVTTLKCELAVQVPDGYLVMPAETIRQAVIAGLELSGEGCNYEYCQLKHNDVMKMFDDAATSVVQFEINRLWAVNIPEEPDSDELLHAATSKEHAQSIVSRLHNEIFETYPTFGEPIADSIYVAEWQDSAEEHAESLATKWWEHTTFLECE